VVGQTCKQMQNAMAIWIVRNAGTLPPMPSFDVEVQSQAEVRRPVLIAIHRQVF
jgi:hypothetical protein